MYATHVAQGLDHGTVLQRREGSAPHARPVGGNDFTRGGIRSRALSWKAGSSVSAVRLGDEPCTPCIGDSMRQRRTPRGTSDRAG